MQHCFLTKGIQIHYCDEVLTHFRLNEQLGTKRGTKAIETYYRPLLAKYIVTELNCKRIKGKEKD
ncbi:hypothetical protein [Metabacillus sp. RGM 3146]|uniref:hypothetical protein n=1 Tax=Metabacillus sp. RGM 3146 TaxID=3401092 RepID=UPI003B9A4EAF